MAVSGKFMGYMGRDLALPRGEWIRVPRTRWKPTRAGLLIPSVYLNVRYTLPKARRSNGRLLVRLMRESPNDSTMWFQMDLERGFRNAFDSRAFVKHWSKGDLGRYVHLEVMAQGTSRCVLQDHCYVSYSQVF